MAEEIFLKLSEETDALGQYEHMKSFSSTRRYSGILTCFHMLNKELQR